MWLSRVALPRKRVERWWFALGGCDALAMLRQLEIGPPSKCGGKDVLLSKVCKWMVLIDTGSWRQKCRVLVFRCLLSFLFWIGPIIPEFWSQTRKGLPVFQWVDTLKYRNQTQDEGQSYDLSQNTLDVHYTDHRKIGRKGRERVYLGKRQHWLGH